MSIQRGKPISGCEVKCPVNEHIIGGCGVKNTLPAVSVIIPTYNRREYVQIAIDSVLAQTFRTFEIVVVDDGSSDGTGDTLAAKYGDQIRYVWQGNQGESAARNWGIDQATGEYIAFLDSDDAWLPDKLGMQIAALESCPRAGLVSSQARLIDAAGEMMDAPVLGLGLHEADFSLPGLVSANSVRLSTVVARKKVLDDAGGFDAGIRFGEDWDLWLRLRAHTGFLFIAKPLVHIRRHVNTQCHLPRRENLERTLVDHLRLLERAFSAWCGPAASVQRLRARSLANEYALAAFGNYAWGQWEQGCAYLDQAIVLDEPTWCDTGLLADRLVDHGVAIAELVGIFDADWMRTYVEGVQRHWPATLTMSRGFVRQVLARLYTEAAYRAYLAGNDVEVRRYTRLALQTNLSLLRDFGLLKRAMRHVA